MADGPRVQTRPVRMGPPDVTVTSEDGGVIRVGAPFPLGPFPARLTDRFDHWAEAAPDRVFVADRSPDGAWRQVTYSEARRIARNIAQALLDRGLSVERPLAILSGNDLEHALLALGSLYAGVPFAPVSPAYSLISTDYVKLRHVLGLVTPGLVYVSDTVPFAPALDAAGEAGDFAVVAGRIADARRNALSFTDLVSVQATATVDAATAGVTPDSIAKFLFTSGTSGVPKAVINTQRMWCANQEMLRTSLAFLGDAPPTLVDWLPWHHTAGGNHNYGLTVYNGGTLYIDNGSPTPDGIPRTVRNLEEVAPTLYFNVPRGYEALCHELERNQRLRETFFSRVQLLQYAGAGMAPHIWEALERLAVDTVGHRIRMVTGYGATETGPFALGPNRPVDRPGMVGIPAHGLEMKLVPTNGKLELRLRGPSITPGYWRQPERTEAAFDEEGYYMIGDALKFVDEADPEQGFQFDGRVSEDFKLDTGTWVNTAAIKAKLVAACAPLAREAVLTGLDSPHIGALIVPDSGACRKLAPDLSDAPHSTVASHPAIRDCIERALGRLAEVATGSSTRVERAVVLPEPPSLDSGELTDKGSINPHAVRALRADLVADLYADPIPPHVITVPGKRP